jgi:lambda family phage tail tape measure protein
VAKNAFNGLEDAIVSLTMTGKFSFKDFALSIIEDLTRMVTRMLIIAPILQFIQSLIPGGGLNLSGAKALSSGKITPGGIFANGGIMTGDGPMPLRKYAAGGIANSPQLAMFGEGSMPEAYVPLPDGRRIPVAMKGGGGGTNVTVNVDATGSQVQGNSGQGEQLGRAISQAVQNELVRQKRPGGLLAA